MADPLRFVVRTPHDVVFEANVISVRVLTETGQVGVRRRMETSVMAVEAGLVLARGGDGVTFIGSAGGLLEVTTTGATLLTPLAVTGRDRREVDEALSAALAEPGSELAIRAALDRLEGRILSELRRQPAGDIPGAGGT